MAADENVYIGITTIDKLVSYGNGPVQLLYNPPLPCQKLNESKYCSIILRDPAISPGLQQPVELLFKEGDNFAFEGNMNERENRSIKIAYNCLYQCKYIDLICLFIFFWESPITSNC